MTGRMSVSGKLSKHFHISCEAGTRAFRNNTHLLQNQSQSWSAAGIYAKQDASQFSQCCLLCCSFDPLLII